MFNMAIFFIIIELLKMTNTIYNNINCYNIYHEKFYA